MFAMLLFRKPAPATTRRFLDEQSRLDFSYAAVWGTAETLPAGYAIDRTRVTLGYGASTYAVAKSALNRWEQFKLGWLEVWPDKTALRQGELVAIITWAVGMWWLNASRIVYTIDSEEPIARYGFAYGTLPGHAETGEERFLVQWDRATDEVAYEILAFSRPRHPLARLGYPLVRRMQKRFARDSCAAMQRAVSSLRA